MPLKHVLVHTAYIVHIRMYVNVLAKSKTSRYKSSGSKKKKPVSEFLRKFSLENGIILYIVFCLVSGMSAGTVLYSIAILVLYKKIRPSLHFLIPLYIPVPIPLPTLITSLIVSPPPPSSESRPNLEILPPPLLLNS